MSLMTNAEGNIKRPQVAMSPYRLLFLKSDVSAAGQEAPALGQFHFRTKRDVVHQRIKPGIPGSLQSREQKGKAIEHGGRHLPAEKRDAHLFQGVEEVVPAPHRSPASPPLLVVGIHALQRHERIEAGKGCRRAGTRQGRRLAGSGLSDRRKGRAASVRLATGAGGAGLDGTGGTVDAHVDTGGGSDAAITAGPG